MAKYFNNIEWLPSADKAAFGIAYTAKLTLNDSVYASGIKFLVDDNAVIKANDGKSGVNARVVEENGKYVIYVLFPTTEKVDLVKVIQPEDINFTREQASASRWDVPKTTTILLADDSTAIVDIKWTEVPEFDPYNKNAQTLTLKGEITLPDYVNDVDGKDTVEVSLNILVPAGEEPTTEPTTEPTSETEEPTESESESSSERTTSSEQEEKATTSNSNDTTVETNSKEPNSEEANNPTTGDKSNFAIWIAVAAVSASVLIAVVKIKTRKR